MNDTTEILTDSTSELPESDFTGPVAPEPDSPEEQRPRLRIGAIVWGLIVSICAAVTLAIVLDPARSAEFANWLGEATGESIGLIALIAAGSVLLLLGLVSLLRQAQRRGERRPD